MSLEELIYIGMITSNGVRIYINFCDYNNFPGNLISFIQGSSYRIGIVVSGVNNVIVEITSSILIANIFIG